MGFPWLTVQDNVEVALKARGMAPRLRAARARFARPRRTRRLRERVSARTVRENASESRIRRVRRVPIVNWLLAMLRAAHRHELEAELYSRPSGWISRLTKPDGSWQTQSTGAATPN